MRQPRDLQSRKPLAHLGLEYEWKNPRPVGWNLSSGEGCLLGSRLSKERLCELWRRHGYCQRPTLRRERQVAIPWLFFYRCPPILLILSNGQIYQEARKKRKPIKQKMARVKTRNVFEGKQALGQHTCYQILNNTDKSCLSLKSLSEAILSFCGLDFEGIRHCNNFGYLDIKEEKIISQLAFELDHKNSRHNNPDLYCRSKNYRGIQLGQMACN